MTYALIVFLAMAVMDSTGALKVRCLATGHPWWAGHAELIGDQTGALSYGVTGASLIRFGFSGTTVLILCALALASELGTHIGYHIGKGIE